MALRFEEHGEHLRAIRGAVLRAVDPMEAVRAAALRRREREGVTRSLGYVAIGKGAARMREGLVGVEDVGSGVVVGPEGVVGQCATAAHPTAVAHESVEHTVLVGDHPLPTERSVAAGEGVRGFVSRCAAEARSRVAAGQDPGVVTLLLSGGASALVCLPAEGVSLEDLRAVTRAMLHAGASIGELNTVRKHVERLKGGRLTELASPARVDAFILSDVIGDDLDVIGSGPVSPDPTTFADALDVLARRDVLEVGPSVTAHLRAGARGETPETPKPGSPCFEGVRTRIVASNTTAVDAARIEAERLGFRVALVRGGVTGEAAHAGVALAEMLRRIPPADRPAAVIFGGETTVTVGKGSRGGKGGRNQEMAVAAAAALHGVPRAAVMTLATDGVDGPTDAAGGVVTGETAAAAREMGIEAVDALARHDSHRFLGAVGGLLRTGPTGTNVCDVAVGVVY